jgi:Ca2+-binding RTX toxin-like protein
MATLYYKISVSGPTYGPIPDSNAKLMIGSKDVGSKYDWHYDSQGGDCYFTREVAEATFVKPADYDTATYEYDHGDIDHPPSKAWRTTYVDDSFVVPSEFRPDKFPEYFTPEPDDFGFFTNGVSFSGGLIGGITIGQFSAYTSDGIWSLVERVAPTFGLTTIANAVGNALTVRGAVESVLNNGLAVFEAGVNGISDPNFSPKDYDALVDAYLGSSQQTLFTALRDLKSFDNPAAEKAFDTLIGGVALVARIQDTGSVPVSGSASFDVEVALGNGVSLNVTIEGSAEAEIILTGNGKKTVKAGGGDDTVVGGRNVDRLLGNDGADSLYGGGGADILIGGGTGDRLVGGTGRDTASYAGSKVGVVANLAKAKKNKGEAAGDQYVSIENLTGSAKSDKLTGNKLNNTLTGGAGNDRLESGLGTDKLTGGKHSDQFVFRTVKDSLNKKKAWDVITDFNQKQGDLIVLKPIDAKKGKKNQAFTFIEDDAFSGIKGELRYEKNAKTTFVYGDVDGDGKADFKIELKGAIDLVKSDFLL